MLHSSAARRDGPEISVIVLAYNEAENLRPTVDELLARLTGMESEFELIIVDDGSVDETGRIADRIAREHPRVRVVHHDVNKGLGGGYRTGFSSARGTYLTFFPGDGQFPAEILATFYPRMADRDLVLGYLVSQRHSWIGKGLSLIERMIYTALFGPLPRFQGVFMVRRSMLTSLPLQSSGRGWAILMEFIIRGKRAGWRIESVPTVARPRASGHSKVNNVRTVTSNLRQLLALRRLL